MTLVIGIKSGAGYLLAADTMASDLHVTENRLDSKLFVNGNLTYGFCGSYRVGQILQFLKLPEFLPEKNSAEKISGKNLPSENSLWGFTVQKIVPKFLKQLRGREGVADDTEWSVLITDGTDIVRVDESGAVAQLNSRYAAVGAGEQFALGYLACAYDVQPTIKPDWAAATVEACIFRASQSIVSVGPHVIIAYENEVMRPGDWWKRVKPGPEEPEKIDVSPIEEEDSIDWPFGKK